MGRWSPIALPQARHRTWRSLTGDQPPTGLRPELAPVFNRCGWDIATAELYWVAADMTALATSAAATLPEVCWATAYRPSASGLLVWDGGVRRDMDIASMIRWAPQRATAASAFARPGAETAHTPVVRLPFDAVSWAPSPEGMHVTAWMRSDAIKDAILGAGGLVPDEMQNMAPLMPTSGWDVPVTAEPYPTADLAAQVADGRLDQTHRTTICRTLAAAWALMQQPKLAERSRLDPPKDEARRASREGRPEPVVTLIDLRRLYRPQVPSEEPADGPSRHYRNRWVVSGHWRNQAVGPKQALRRQTWIPSYVKGPDGAPLLQTERVNVWRR